MAMESDGVTMKPDLLVTDFAGTTFRDDGAVIVAYQRALSENGIPFTDDELRAKRGASKRAVLEEFSRRAFSRDEAGAIASRALETFETALVDAYQSGPVEEVPGAAAAVTRLRESGVRVALTTGFQRPLVNLLLERLGWTSLFDHVVTGEDVSLGRPAPFLIYQAMIRLDVGDVRRVAVIGDTPLDLEAGMRAQAGWVIGVLSGAHGLETLGRTPHTHIISSVADLPELFDL